MSVLLYFLVFWRTSGMISLLTPLLGSSGSEMSSSSLLRKLSLIISLSRHALTAKPTRRCLGRLALSASSFELISVHLVTVLLFFAVMRLHVSFTSSARESHRISLWADLCSPLMSVLRWLFRLRSTIERNKSLTSSVLILQNHKLIILRRRLLWRDQLAVLNFWQSLRST